MKRLIIYLSLVFLASCGNKAPQVPDTAATPIPSPSAERLVFQWEIDPSTPARKPWSDHLDKLITEHLPKFKKGADWPQICPKWKELNDRQKTHVSGVMVVGVILFESNHNPLSRMKETVLQGKPNPIDPITGTFVYSEGLMQLSYQDKQWAPWCAFDWSKDKLLDPKSPKKTILDPYINLSCGVRIMANQIEKKGLVFPVSGYWAVGNTGSKYSQVPAIKAKIKKYAPECF